MSERHQVQLPTYPQLRWGWEQCQQQCNLRAPTTGERCHHRAHSQVNSSTGGIRSGFPPSGSAPIPRTSHCWPKTAKKQMWGNLPQQLGSRPHLWQGSDNHRAKGRPYSISSAGSCNHNISHTAYKGVTASIHWGKRWQTSILKTTHIKKY